MSENMRECYLAERVALVTGGAQGNGRAIAAELEHWKKTKPKLSYPVR